MFAAMVHVLRTGIPGGDLPERFVNDGTAERGQPRSPFGSARRATASPPVPLAAGTTEKPFLPSLSIAVCPSGASSSMTRIDTGWSGVMRVPVVEEGGAGLT